jgi:hypothetical protein
MYVGLKRLGFGAGFSDEDIAKSRLSHGPHLHTLRTRIAEEPFFFEQLRELLQFVFSNGETSYLGRWRDSYFGGAWRNLFDTLGPDNPGVLADSWLATLSSDFRIRIGESLLARLIRNFRAGTPGPDKEFIVHELNLRNQEERIEFALEQALKDGLLDPDIKTTVLRYPFRVGTLTDICLTPLDLSDSFFPSLERLLEKSQSFGSTVGIGKGKLLRSRSLWALQAITSAKRPMSEAAEIVVNTHELGSVPGVSSSLELCLVHGGAALSGESAENVLAQIKKLRAPALPEYQHIHKLLWPDNSNLALNFYSQFCASRRDFQSWKALVSAYAEWALTETPPDEIAEWMTMGCTPSDAKMLKEAELPPSNSPPQLRKAGIKVSVENLKRWKGLSSELILAAIDRGFDNSEQFIPFAYSKLERSEVDALRNLLPQDFPLRYLERFKELRMAGVDLRYAAELSQFENLLTKQALELQSLHLDIELVKQWCYGVTRHDVRMAWLKLPEPPPFSTVARWVAFELKPKEFEKYRHLIGPTLSPSEVAKWAWLGVAPGDVQGWRDAGISDPFQARRWLHFGISHHDLLTRITSRLDVSDEYIDAWYLRTAADSDNRSSAIAWIKTGATLDEADHWHSHNLTPQEYDFWKSKSVSAPDAKRWKTLGLPTSEYLKWTEEGFSLESALKWLTKHRKITPLIARRRAEAGIAP